MWWGIFFFIKKENYLLLEIYESLLLEIFFCGFIILGSFGGVDKGVIIIGLNFLFIIKIKKSVSIL